MKSAKDSGNICMKSTKQDRNISMKSTQEDGIINMKSAKDNGNSYIYIYIRKVQKRIEICVENTKEI